MGCFDELRIPWERSQDLGEGDAAGLHMAENLRELDRWANALTDGCGSNPARINGGYFSGTVTVATTLILDDSVLDGGVGSYVAVDGDMEWDGTTGEITLPRPGMYVGSMQLVTGDDGLADPYWIALNAPAGDVRLLPPFPLAAGVLSVSTSLFYNPFDTTGTFIRIGNNITAGGDLLFEMCSFSICEIPNSVLPTP